MLLPLPIIAPLAIISAMPGALPARYSHDHDLRLEQ